MPEEINRIVTDMLSDYLFTPSRFADENLRRQGIPEEKIYFVGNVMVDALLSALEIARKRQTWKRWGYSPGDYAVLTLHRASNVDEIDMLLNLIGTVKEIAAHLPVIFPIHPRTMKQLESTGDIMAIRNLPGLILTEPLGYLDFLCLMSGARLVLTDSGGIQSETTMLGIPCLTLRWNTEWLETVSQGTNHLVGTDREPILREFQAILDADERPVTRPENWDGLAARRIVEILRRQI
jgi:UDP-N-acetylglucosamine 2-epimerase (non-hydrolysing)